MSKVMATEAFVCCDLILYFRLSEIQWAAFILLCAGCTTAQLNTK